MNNKSRFPKYATIVLCAVVLLLSAVIVIGTWAAVGPASSAVVDLLNTVEKTAIRLGAALDRVSTRIDQAQTFAQDFQSGAMKMSQNVQDQGVILTLFPEAKDGQIVSSVQSIQDTYQGFVDTVESLQSLVQAINRFPFVNLSGIDSAKIQGVMEKINQAKQLANTVVSSIQQIRTQTAAGVEAVSSAVGGLEAKLNEIDSNLADIRSQIQFVQTTAGNLKTTIPTLFTTIAFLITLFFAWIIYTQVVMAHSALDELHKMKALPLGEKPVEAPPAAELAAEEKPAEAIAAASPAKKAAPKKEQN